MMARRQVRVVAIVSTFALLAVAPARGADPDLESLRRDVNELKRDLAEIKELLKQGAAGRAPFSAAPGSGTAAADAVVRVAGYPAMGRPTARIAIVEFSSYQCPYCRRHFERTLPQIKKTFVDEGKVQYVFHDVPLQGQPDSPNAAKAAWCARQQAPDKFWPMHDTLFRNQRNLSVESLKGYAQGLGLDGAAFSACLDGAPATEALSRSSAEAVAVGVRGTPTFFIGPTEDGTMVRGRRLIGAQSFETFRQAIEIELDQLTKK